MIMKGRLRYHDIHYAELVDGVLLDGEGNQEFPLSTKKRYVALHVLISNSLCEFLCMRLRL
jgi:hypothetical protein